PVRLIAPQQRRLEPKPRLQVLSKRISVGYLGGEHAVDCLGGILRRRSGSCGNIRRRRGSNSPAWQSSRCGRFPHTGLLLLSSASSQVPLPSPSSSLLVASRLSSLPLVTKFSSSSETSTRGPMLQGPRACRAQASILRSEASLDRPSFSRSGAAIR